MGTPYPCTLLLKTKRGIVQDSLRKLFHQFGKVAVSELKDHQGETFASITFSSADVCRKAMLKILAKKLKEILDAEFDLDSN